MAIQKNGATVGPVYNSQNVHKKSFQPKYISNSCNAQSCWRGNIILDVLAVVTKVYFLSSWLLRQRASSLTTTKSITKMMWCKKK